MEKHIAIIWQRFLPYHKARIQHLHNQLSKMGWRLSALEVTTKDDAYTFPENTYAGSADYICCFPGKSYHSLKEKEIHSKVLTILKKLQPDIVFAPASAFPEGMAAYYHRLLHASTAVMMDDMWEGSDRKGIVTRSIKKLINKNIDAVFVPAPSHADYYNQMGFPRERIVFGVDVVDNEFFSSMVDNVRSQATSFRKSAALPQNYFLFVGRFLPRKGLEDLIEAYRMYRSKILSDPWELVLVGSGDHLHQIQKLAEGIAGISFAGPRFDDDLCTYYGLARAIIVPSTTEPWGLVVNEAMASGLPVIVSTGCGAAKTLVHEGENGWTFEPYDIQKLADIMLMTSGLPVELLDNMGKKSRQIISEWSLDRFTDGVMKAVEIPRRPAAGIISNIITRFWKGRVRIN